MNNMDELSKEEMTKICVQTLTDDTHWDLMTGSLLKKRLKAYFEDLDNQQKLVSAMNCLRLTELVYLIKQEGDAITMPIVPVPEGTTMMLFTSKKEIKQTNLKAFEPRESLLPEILDCFDSDEVKFIVINPNTDSFILPMELVKQVFEVIENIISDLDAEKQKGIVAKDLTALMFERFGGCTVEIDTKDGRHIVGDAYAYCKDEKGQCLTVTISESEKIDVYKNEVKTIKDISNYED